MEGSEAANNVEINLNVFLSGVRCEETRFIAAGLFESKLVMDLREVRLKAGYGARTIEGVRSTFEHGKQHPLVDTPLSYLSLSLSPSISFRIAHRSFE